MIYMVITKLAGNIGEVSSTSKTIDWLELEWEELNKKILRKKTASGMDIAISLENSGSLRYGDILFENDDTLVAIRTKLEKVFVIKPKTMQEMGKTAFEIGNRHTPCIIEENEMIVRFDQTLTKLLNEIGVAYDETERRFKEAFKYKGHQH